MSLMPSLMPLAGTLAVRKITPRRWSNSWEVLRWKLRHAVVQRWREWPLEAVLLAIQLLQWVVPGLQVPMHGRLYLRVTRRRAGQIEVLDYGMVGCHLIVTAGKNAAAGYWNASTTAGLWKYHGFGTNATAANAADTTLGTELTTQYATDNVRPTGSQALNNNVYTTVATLSPDSGGTIAVTEWGLFSQAANSGGTLFDHQVFSAVNLVAGSDSLQATYNLTVG